MSQADGEKRLASVRRFVGPHVLGRQSVSGPGDRTEKLGARHCRRVARPNWSANSRGRSAAAGAEWRPCRHRQINTAHWRARHGDGAARFTVDVKLPGMLFARILRSPHPHARIVTAEYRVVEMG